MRLPHRAFSLALLLIVSACASRPAEPVPERPAPPAGPVQPAPPPPEPPPPANAVAAGVVRVAPLVLPDEQAQRALAAFRISCRAAVRREDPSGLTRPADWTTVCAQAASLPEQSAAAFFYHGFDWLRIGEGKAFATGYYEPEIAGSRTALPDHVPVYRTPPDLIRCTHSDGKEGRGRIDPLTGLCTLYFTRSQIEDGALAGKGLELAWARDPIELFFLHIQGSGRIRFPDGTVMRIGYDNQNGRDYVAIGRLLRERGILPPGGASMQAIVDWMRANPDQGRALMRENPSYIFFRELTGAGPLGALNLPVTAQSSVAADPKFVPLGAPVLLFAMDRPEANGLWVAQDTGGAIKGANRFDTFWGAGEAATRIAGGMASNGQSLVLVPKGAFPDAPAQP